MSWTMWHVYGIGFDVSKADPEDRTEDRLQNFLVKHLKTLVQAADEHKGLKPVIDWIYQHPLQAMSVETLQEMTQSGTAAEIIAEIMAKETNLCYCYPGITDEGEDYVLYSPTYPWRMTEDERKIRSFENLATIMQPYADELGISLNEDVDLIYAG